MIAADNKSVSLQLKKTAWVGTITLPMHPTNNSKSHFVRLNQNYALVKHMMSELNLKQNSDYIILRPNTKDEATITLKFCPNVKHVSSMVVMHWYKYKDAKIESTL